MKTRRPEQPPSGNHQEAPELGRETEKERAWKQAELKIQELHDRMQREFDEAEKINQPLRQRREHGEITMDQYLEQMAEYPHPLDQGIDQILIALEACEFTPVGSCFGHPENVSTSEDIKKKLNSWETYHGSNFPYVLLSPKIVDWDSAKRLEDRVKLALHEFYTGRIDQHRIIATRRDESKLKNPKDARYGRILTKNSMELTFEPDNSLVLEPQNVTKVSEIFVEKIKKAIADRQKELEDFAEFLKKRFFAS